MTTNTHKILIVDDEPSILDTLERTLAGQYAVFRAGDGEEALEILREEEMAMTIADQRMPGMSGVLLLMRSREIQPDMIRIVLTGYTDIETAIDAINMGAVYRYVQKPWDPQEFLITIRRALESYELKMENLRLMDELKEANERLRRENAYWRSEAAKEHAFPNIIGRSPAMIQVFERMKKAVETDVTVCIYGETGTGKELVARALHYSGPRKEKKFYPQNCGAMPDTLLTSELFGHKKGAFTGAVEDKKGLFESADGGSVFLDEIGETSELMQSGLLRVLQEREIKPVGSQEYKKVDIRLIVATNRDLKKATEEGTFRQDLFFRVNVFPLHLPPLRERVEDIPVLANYFLLKHSEQYKKPVVRIQPEALGLLESYAFPGNVRELENIIETAVVLATGEEVEQKDLPAQFQDGSYEKSPTAVPRTNEELKVEKKRITEDLERLFVVHSLKRHNGKVADAARETGMNRTMFHDLISKYNIDTREYR
jgi:DNA-binding NtrC family response regulator